MFIYLVIWLSLIKIVCELTMDANTVCLRSLDPFYIVMYKIKWVKTFWT